MDELKKKALQKLLGLKDSREHSLSGLVDEAFDLKIASLLIGSEEKKNEDQKKMIERIEARLEIVYGELDRREKLYRGACELPGGKIEGGFYR